MTWPWNLDGTKKHPDQIAEENFREELEKLTRNSLIQTIIDLNKIISGMIGKKK